MTFEMIDRQVRFAKTNCETFRDGRTDHERTRQAGAAGGGERIHFDNRVLAALAARSSSRGA